MGKVNRIVAFALVACMLFSLTAFAESKEVQTGDSIQVTLYAQFELFDEPHYTRLTGAALSPQTLEVRPALGAEYEGWYSLETWLGSKWLYLNTPGVLPVLFPEDKTLTLLQETPLYDTPDQSTESVAKVSPQKVHATGIMSTCYRDRSRGYSNCDVKWWRVNTWLGEKWIAPEEYLERIVERPYNSSFQVKKETPVHLYPFRSQKTDKELAAGTKVEVKAMYLTVPSRAGPDSWYKIETTDGDRWIHDPDDTFFGLLAVDEKVTPEVPFHYFTDPDIRSREPGLHEPRELVAFEKRDNDERGWVRVHTPDGDKWIHPERAKLENPPGIKETRLTIKVDPISLVSNFPFKDPYGLFERKFSKGEEELQTTHSYEEKGVGTWYRVAVDKEFKWVLVPTGAS